MTVVVATIKERGRKMIKVYSGNVNNCNNINSNNDNNNDNSKYPTNATHAHMCVSLNLLRFIARAKGVKR